MAYEDRNMSFFAKRVGFAFISLIHTIYRHVQLCYLTA